MKEGTVIHGTTRLQDLIPEFMDELNRRAPVRYEQMTCGCFPPIPSYVMDEGDDSEWWDGEEAYYLLEGLLDALDEEAPEGCYFGAHPGDGSDYGFWREEEL